MNKKQREQYWQAYFLIYWFSISNHTLSEDSFHTWFTGTWFDSYNETLNALPIVLIQKGKGKKLINLILEAFNEVDYWSDK